MRYRQAIIKRKIEACMAWPFIFAGRLLSPLFPLKTKHQLVIFCPSADIGGANKVNADLCRVFAHKNPLVIFSKKPRNNEFFHLFQIPGVRIIDLHKQVDQKAWHFINFFYRGVISSWINTCGTTIVAGGESLFFYKVFPYVKKDIRFVEISHLNTWFQFTQSFVKDIDARVFSTLKLKRDAEALYVKNNLPKALFRRLFFIDNMVEIPPLTSVQNDRLEVVFVGRGSPQKRVHLVAAIAQKLHAMKANVHVSFVGDVTSVLVTSQYTYCTFYGNVQDKQQMQAIYQKSDVLLLTSAFEGLPLAIMEMMAYGKVVVSTAVDAIPDYIIPGETGFLIENHTDEDKIVEEGVSILSSLSTNPGLLREVGQKSREYAEKQFSEEAFFRAYQTMFYGQLADAKNTLSPSQDRIR